VFFLWLLSSVSCSWTTAGEHHWPRFRGPNASGVAPDHEGLPITWTATKNVKWVADVPGWGSSCPVVWNDRVFLTAVVADQPTQVPKKGMYLGQGVREPAKGIHHWMVYCFDLNMGEMLWKHEAHTGQPQVPRHPKSTYASETPTTDGKRLYVLFGDLGLWCYDLQGKPLWQRKIEPKKTEFDYGAAASPVVHDGQVIVVYDGGFLTCHDARSGDEVYGKRRFSPSGSFTALPFAFNGRLFCLSEDGLTYVVKPGSEFEILQCNPLDELCLSSPAIVGDKLLIRTASKLYCLTEGAELDPGPIHRCDSH